MSSVGSHPNLVNLIGACTKGGRVDVTVVVDNLLITVIVVVSDAYVITIIFNDE